MEYGNTLISAAAAKVGSRYKLALRLGESESFLSKVAAGKKPLPASLAARMAALAGMDARRAALEAVLSHEKNYEKQVALAEALGLPTPPPTDDNQPALLQAIS